jgi:hypothetical protein
MERWCVPLSLVALLISASVATAEKLHWPSDIPVSPISSTDIHHNPDIALLPNGTMAVAWCVENSTLGYGQVRAQLIDTDGQPLLGSEISVSDIPGVAACAPAVAADLSGNIIIAWIDGRFDTGGFEIAVVAQKFSPAGARMWPGDVIVNASVASAGGDGIDIGVDAFGNSYVVWENWTGWLEWNVHAQKLDPSGVRQWSAGDVVVSPVGIGDQLVPRIAVGPTGVSYIAWSNGSWGTGDISAQSLANDGTSQWGPGVTVNQHLPDEQYLPGIALTSTGSLAVGWADTRDGTPALYAQELDGAGSAQWGPSDRKVSDSAAAVAWYLDVAVDTTLEAGEFLFSWSDSRAGGSVEIYAQRTDSTGNPLWSSGDVKVNQRSEPGNDLFMPRSVHHPGVSDFFLVWMQQFGTEAGVYAQRLTESGSVPELSSWIAFAVSLSLVTATAVLVHVRVRASRLPYCASRN